MSLALLNLRGQCSEAQAPHRTLRVLTLTPFFPADEDPAQGGFVADPVTWTERLGVRNEVIAARPFYRRRLHDTTCAVPARWQSHFALPGNWGLPTSGLFLAWELMSEVRSRPWSRPFDLIHAHAALPCGQAAAILAKRLSIPFVVSVHGLDAFAVRQAGATRARWSKKACADVYRRAQAVICISEKVREQVDDLVEANTVVVHNGVDEEMFSPAPELPSPLTVLSVGNLIPIKGHALLLRAFARILNTIPECRLVIIGDGCERESLVRLSEGLGIAPHVGFLGRQNRRVVAEAMKRCAVFALPSKYEGLGCVYLEAMAAGKPAIGCKGQGIEEIIEHGRNGLLVQPENETELSEALRTLLQNENFRRRIGNSARTTVLESHTLRHQAEKLIRVYRESVQ